VPDLAGLQKKLLIWDFLLVQPGGWLKTMSKLVLVVADSANLFKKCILCMAACLLSWKIEITEKKSSSLLNNNTENRNPGMTAKASDQPGTSGPYG